MTATVSQFYPAMSNDLPPVTEASVFQAVAESNAERALIGYPPHPTYRDRPHVTLAVRAALRDPRRVGVALAELVKLLPIDDQTAAAHELGEAAITAYLKEGGQ